MGSWILMLIITLLLPFTMIGIGSYYVIKGGPKEINETSGYRTAMSMKNKDTWLFAHVYCGRLCRVIGCIVLPLSVIAMLFVVGKGAGLIGACGGIVAIVQLIFLVIPVILTEKALGRTFDEEGNRRN